MKGMTLRLTHPEYHSIILTLEGCIEELEILMREHDWYTTELPDRLQTCIEILERAQ
jgi:hypothetical protein